MKLRALAILVAAPLGAQTIDNAFFEKEIRPVLANKCFACHSSKLKTPMGGLVLDTRAGMRAGGDGGAILVPGSPDASRLIEALEYKDSELRMPPAGKLPAREIEAFRQWIAGGAPDPRVESGKAIFNAGVGYGILGHHGNSAQDHRRGAGGTSRKGTTSLR